MRPFFLCALLLSFSWVTRAQDLAVVGARVYASPTATPVDNATIVISAGKIVAVGKHVPVPAGGEDTTVRGLRRVRRLLEYACPFHGGEVDGCIEPACR